MSKRKVERKNNPHVGGSFNEFLEETGEREELELLSYKKEVERLKKELAEAKNLRSGSQMLGAIASNVSEFCESEDDTTLMAVLNLLAEYHYLKSEEYSMRVEKLRAELEEPK